MKNLLYLLFAVCLFSACSSSEDEPPYQDYTSFVVKNNTSIDLPNCVAGYQKDGLWIKIADIGDLNSGKYSEEIKLDKFIKEDIYIFTDYLSPRKIDVAFSLKENKQNLFENKKGDKAVLVTNKEDATQYPQ